VGERGRERERERTEAGNNGRNIETLGRQKRKVEKEIKKGKSVEKT
jgi:hypothetical protein